MKRHARALRAFTHADDSFAKKQVILDMDAGQFADWSAEGVDLVREATAAEVAAARGEKPKAAKKPAPATPPDETPDPDATAPDA